MYPFREENGGSCWNFYVGVSFNCLVLIIRWSTIYIRELKRKTKGKWGGNIMHPRVHEMEGGVRLLTMG